MQICLGSMELVVKERKFSYAIISTLQCQSSSGSVVRALISNQKTLVQHTNLTLSLPFRPTCLVIIHTYFATVAG